MKNSSTARCWYAVTLVCLIALGFAAKLSAQSPAASSSDGYPSSLFSTEYLASLWEDSRAVLTEPPRWDESNWRDASLWTGATLLAAAFDHQIRNQAQNHYRTQSADHFTKNWQLLGAEYSFAEIGAFEVWGVATDNQNARETAMDAVTATVIASGIITPALKYSVGRYRPTQTHDTFRFRPFSGRQSFPSGHATQAFAVATVIASHFTAPWEQALSYGAAALVDLSRVQQNAHFASDVVAGSAIGWAVARAVVHRHHPVRLGSFDVQPWITGDGTGLVLARDF